MSNFMGNDDIGYNHSFQSNPNIFSGFTECKNNLEQNSRKSCVQKMKQLDLQKQQQILDYKDVSDIFMSLLSTAEAIAFQNSNEKELGYYDEFDTANRKTLNLQIIQFLRLLRDFDIIRNDYENIYGEIYKFPEGITKEYIYRKVNSFLNRTEKNDILIKYYEEIINIINKSKKINIKEELNKYYTKNNATDEVNENNRWGNLIGIKHLLREEDKQVIDQYMRTGKYEYKVLLSKKPGRYCHVIMDKKTKNKKLEFYTDMK